MKIVIKTLKGTSFEIEVDPDASVAEVKEKIENVVGANASPAAQQILIHEGRVLRDETTMEANQVLEGSVIAIMMNQGTSNLRSIPETQELAAPLLHNQEVVDTLPQTQEPTAPATTRPEPLSHHLPENQSLRPLVQSSAPEDDKVEVPYDDPFYGFEQFTEEDLVNVMADPNPNLMDMSFLGNSEPPVFPTLPVEVDETRLQQELNLSITNDEFDGLCFMDEGFTMSWDMFEPPNDDLNENINNHVPEVIGNDNGNNTNVGETTRLEVSTRVFRNAIGPNFETGGTSTRRVPVPRMSDGVYVCDCCKMLREMVHVKEGEKSTLYIHGGIGFLCHAVLLIASDSMEHEPQTIHLNDLTMEEIKRFIEEYCSQRVSSGSALVQDTNAAFYQAMSATSVFNQSPATLTIPSRPNVPMSLVSPDEALGVPPVPLHVGLRDEPKTIVPKERQKRKTPLAAQRERTGKLTLKDISNLFELPINEAAKEMKLCPTVLKKICRKGGLMRWPHRKIRSLLNKIESLKSSLSSAKNVEAKVRMEAEIERLQRQIEKICGDILRNMK